MRPGVNRRSEISVLIRFLSGIVFRPACFRYKRVFFANFNGAGPGLSSVTMKFTANTITGLDWAAKVHSHGSYVHFETTAPCKLNYFIFPASLDLRGIAIKTAHLKQNTILWRGWRKFPQLQNSGRFEINGLARWQC